MFFMSQRTACFLPQGQRGGCGIKSCGGVTSPHSLKSFVFRDLPLLFGFHNDDTEKSGKTIATPQKKGGHAAPCSGAMWHTPYTGPKGSLSSVFIPAGRLGTAPRRGAERRRTELYDALRSVAAWVPWHLRRLLRRFLRSWRAQLLQWLLLDGSTIVDLIKLVGGTLCES